MGNVVVGLLLVENENELLSNSLRNEYIEKINSEFKRKESYTSWKVLEDLLKYLDLNANNCYINNNRWFLDDCNFNISHDTLCGAIASIDYKVSIDIVDSNRKIDFERLLPIISNDDELEFIDKLNLSIELKFGLLWSAKEALYKYSNDNDRFIPKNFSILNISNIYFIDNRFFVAIKTDGTDVQFINTNSEIKPIIINGKIM